MSATAPSTHAAAAARGAASGGGASDKFFVASSKSSDVRAANIIAVRGALARGWSAVRRTLEAGGWR